MQYPNRRRLQTDFIEGVFAKNLELENQHPTEAHIGLTDEDMLSRFVFEGKPTSSFLDEVDYEQCLYQIVIRNYDEIFNNIEKLNNSDRIDVQFDDKKKRFGVKQLKTLHVKKVYTYHIKAIFEIDDTTPYGIRLITVYPDIDGEYTYTMNDNLAPILKDTQGYLKTSSLKRLYFEITTQENIPYQIEDIPISAQKKKTNPVFEIRDKQFSNRLIQVQITNKKSLWKYIMIRKDKSGKSMYSYLNISNSDKIDICLRFPEFYNYIISLETRLNKIRGELNIDRQHYQQKINNAN